MICESVDRMCWHLPWRWTRPYRRWRLARRIDALTPEQRRVLETRLNMMAYAVQNSGVTIEQAARGIGMAARARREGSSDRS